MKNLIYRKYCLIIVSLVLVSIHIQAQSGVWTKFGDMPERRYGHTVDEINGKVYVIGGAIDEGSEIPTHSLIYDLFSGEWSQMDLYNNSIRGAHNSCVVDSKLYIVGGNDGVRTVATMEMFDPDSGKWISKPSMPTDRGLAACAAIDEKIYVIGGIRGSLSSPDYSGINKVEVYDTKSDTWTHMADMPTKRWGCSAVAFEGKIYVFGGCTFGSPTITYNTVEVYDSKTNTWTTKLAKMPTPRYCLTSYLLDSLIYVIGGWYHSSNGPIYDKVEVYNPVTDEWKIVKSLPAKLAVLASTAIDGKIYVFGGARTTHPNYGTSAIYVFSQTKIPAGNVSGTWALANSPYHIIGEITIPNDSTLTIEPGVEVIFKGHYKFNVQGRLLAIGTKNDSIRFTAEDKDAGWHGIRFNQTLSTNDTSKLIYCSFRYGKANTGSGLDSAGGAIMISRFDKVVVSNSLFEQNWSYGNIDETGGAAIFIEWASPLIKENTLKNNLGIGAIKCIYTSSAKLLNNSFLYNGGPYGAIVCGYSSLNQPTISNNIISNNHSYGAGGIFFYAGSYAKVENNIIINNVGLLGGGIVCTAASPVLINNTIAYNSAPNSGGIYCEANSNPVFINNILYGNTAATGNQVFIDDAASDPIFIYNDVQGGKEGFEGDGSGINYSGLYENNIDADPLFKDTALVNYSLSNSSQCIGAGIDSIEVAGVWYYAPSFCKMGNPRPSPSGSNPDIGAYENLLGTFVGVKEELKVPKEFALFQNYPNPFNPSTKISWQSPVSSRQTLKIFDLLGREVATLIDEEKPAGSYEVTWNATNLPSGVYFYQLKAGSFTATKKLLLLK
jgi:N-acetylneuraminic acid mutarotase